LLTDICKDGIGFLLAGLGPTVVGYGLEEALKFGFYETFKKMFKNLTKHQVANFLLASIVAGAVASVVLVIKVLNDH
jgi:solute carrier family 25 phosphate transporter 3